MLYLTRSRGVAQLGSVPVWGTGGRRFKSSRPDHFFKDFSTKTFAVPKVFVVASRWRTLPLAHPPLFTVDYQHEYTRGENCRL